MLLVYVDDHYKVDDSLLYVSKSDRSYESRSLTVNWKYKLADNYI